LKRLIRFPRHPDPSLQTLWEGTQLAVLLLPLSSLLSSVAISLISLILLKFRFKSIARRAVNWGLWGVGLLMLLSSILAYQPPEAWLGLANFLPFFIVFAALSELIQTPHQLRRIAWLLVISSVPVVLIGFGQQFWGWAGPVQVFGSIVNWTIHPGGNPLGRMASIFFYANVLASFLVVSFILNLGLLVEVSLSPQPIPEKQKDLETSHSSPTIHPSPVSPPYLRLFLALVLVGNAIALIFTNSRNAWAVAILACLAFAFYQGWRWLLAGVAVVVGAVLGAAFAPSPLQQGLRAIVPAFFWARLTDQLYPNRPFAELRTTQWQFAWSLTQQRPWLGWGLRNFSPLYQSQMQFFIGHPHNLLLMLAAETGLPATLLLLALVGWVVFQGASLVYRWPSFAPIESSPAFTLPQNNGDRLILFTYLTAFLGCTLFSLLDITLFDVRINLLGWLLLAGIFGLVCAQTKKNVGKGWSDGVME
jgi:O-antigen ligase